MHHYFRGVKPGPARTLRGHPGAGRGRRPIHGARGRGRPDGRSSPVGRAHGGPAAPARGTLVPRLPGPAEAHRDHGRRLVVHRLSGRPWRRYPLVQWTASRAVGVGTFWINDGDPDMASGTLYPHRAKLLAKDVKNGRYTASS